MTNEEVKKIINDERTEQQTVLFCHHWEMATQRLNELAKELESGIGTCIEAEVYATMMRMQSAIMALVELNKMPCAYLFSDYLNRIEMAISDNSINRSIMTLFFKLQFEKPTMKRGDFIDFVIQSLAQHLALPQEKQKAIEEKALPMQRIVSICAQYMNPEDLMMILQVFQRINSEDDNDGEDKVTDYIQSFRNKMDELSEKMEENLMKMMVCLLLLTMLPEMIINMIKQGRSNSKPMAGLFNKVLVRVRQSYNWDNYWKDRRDTLRVVSDSCSWSDIMTAERTKVLAELGKVPGGLFAKWSTDREVFDASFLDAHLSDDDLRQFIFHLAYLYEVARELDPLTKFGDENIVNTELQQVGDAVMAAARKLNDLVDGAWLPYYDSMWKELIENETVFARLKVTRKSPHNNLFTARFFCHLVGEMKKSAVFGVHSDNDLAEKLTDKRSVGTFRKNIQEGVGGDEAEVNILFRDICLKYKQLAHSKRQLHSN